MSKDKVEMTDNNVENRENNFDEKGRFCKGNTISKSKKRNRTQTDKLLAALKREGRIQNKKFWDAVAEKAFKDKEIMKAVINKLVPNIIKNELTGAGGGPVTYIEHFPALPVKEAKKINEEV